MSSCMLCPRRCGVDREKEIGFCGVGSLPRIARAAPHFGEEPCISGARGSGTVFFSGCALRCVFCQNHEISALGRGREVSVSVLAEIFTQLEDAGVHNLNLVTATHFTQSVIAALKLARPKIPVVWNSSGYESLETLKALEGYVQVYMPDLKYSLPDKARRYSGAADYPETARAAILEMYRQRGKYALNSEGLLKSGVLIRHLILPGGLEDALDIIDWVSESFPKDGVLFSLMSQFTPMTEVKKFPELSRKISESEQKKAQAYLALSRIENGYTQDREAATTEMVPEWGGGQLKINNEE